MKTFLQKFADIVFVPGTSKLFPKALNAAWLAITDENEEDNWVDWYNGNNVDILDGVNGQLGTYIHFFFQLIREALQKCGFSGGGGWGLGSKFHTF